VATSTIVKGIRKAWEYSKAVGVDQVFTDPSPLKISTEFKELAFSRLLKNPMACRTPA